MTDYSVHIEVDRRSIAKDELENIVDELAAFHAAVGFSPRGWADAQLTVPANTLTQATLIGLSLVTTSLHGNPIRVEVMTQEEFDSREGFQQTPELIGVTEAADLLDKSRQRVLQMIDEGKLAGQKIGSSIVLVRSEVEAAATRDREFKAYQQALLREINQTK